MQYCAFRASGQMGPDTGSLARSQLAIDIGLDQKVQLITNRDIDVGHDSLSFENPIRVRRARQRRDMTVPIGVSMIREISL